MVKDLQNLIRDLQRLDPVTYANDPLVADRIQTRYSLACSRWRWNSAAKWKMPTAAAASAAPEARRYRKVLPMLSLSITGD
jgi:hypothetical protein